MYKKTFASLIFFTIAVISYAQVGGNVSREYQYVNVSARALVLDAKTSEPIPFATVYLIPQGDTTITNIALSDENGQVLLEKVVTGRYELYAELLGYKTFTNVYDIYRPPGWEVYLGIIGMEESTDSIDAATITAVGNPIIIQKDTVIYNASSFHVGENAKLEDLLKKMPGIQVSEDGTATVNGEQVNRITVGGKTFFFGDPSIALKNLPAKIVKQIKVSRQESKLAQMGAVSTEVKKETVMDVELKEEYQEGWFGDVRLGAGATLNKKNDNPLTQDTKFLYDGGAMATIYGKKEQAVFIGNAYNVQESGSDAGSSEFSDLYDDDYFTLGGLTTAIKGGANYNTSRIKNFETTVSANYRHVTKDDRQRSSRTSFVSGSDDFLTEGGKDARGQEDQLMVNMELVKRQEKLQVGFTPRLYMRKSSVNSSNFSDTYYSGEALPFNSTSGYSISDDRQLYTSGAFNITRKNLGKTGRMLGLRSNYSVGASNGDKFENSLQTLSYDMLGRALNLDGRIFYYEPLGSRWGLQAQVYSMWNTHLNKREAKNADGTYNDFYTSRIGRRTLYEGTGLLMQYSNDTSTVKFGFSALAYNDKIEATMLGINTVTGKGDWRFNITPVVMYTYSKDGHDLTLQYTSVIDQVSGRMLIPAPDISNPVQITAGNTYLKSGIEYGFMAYYNMVNYTTYTFLNVYAFANLETNETVYASWFDSAGVRYAVPVNAKKPGVNASASITLNQPIGAKKYFTFTVSGHAGIDNHHSYQAKSLQPGLNLASFDYNSFMNEFWGDKSGDRFYSGESGFAESRITSYNWRLGLDLKYNKGFFTGIAKASAINSRASYSLNSAANINVWDFNFGGDLLFTLGKGWEIGTDARYVFFRGYAYGYGEPEVRWNTSVSKTIGAFTLALKCRDILNQERQLKRIVSSEYVEDSYRNVMGRTILFSVSFNFGKLNSNKTSAVSRAIDRLEY